MLATSNLVTQAKTLGFDRYKGLNKPLKTRVKPIRSNKDKDTKQKKPNDSEKLNKDQENKDAEKWKKLSQNPETKQFLKRLTQNIKQNKEEDKAFFKKDSWTETFASFVGFGALPGLFAAFFGMYQHFDVYGNFHIDTFDVLLGLKLILPLYALDIVLLTPDWNKILNKSKQVDVQQVVNKVSQQQKDGKNKDENIQLFDQPIKFSNSRFYSSPFYKKYNQIYQSRLQAKQQSKGQTEQFNQTTQDAIKNLNQIKQKDPKAEGYMQGINNNSWELLKDQIVDDYVFLGNDPQNLKDKYQVKFSRQRQGIDKQLEITRLPIKKTIPDLNKEFKLQGFLELNKQRGSSLRRQFLKSKLMESSDLGTVDLLSRFIGDEEEQLVRREKEEQILRDLNKYHKEYVEKNKQKPKQEMQAQTLEGENVTAQVEEIQMDEKQQESIKLQLSKYKQQTGKEPPRIFIIDINVIDDGSQGYQDKEFLDFFLQNAGRKEPLGDDVKEQLKSNILTALEEAKAQKSKENNPLNQIYLQSLETLASWQSNKVFRMGRVKRNILQEIILCSVVQVAQEMVRRGVVLSWGAMWVMDRFYEAGIQDSNYVVDIFGSTFLLDIRNVAQFTILLAWALFVVSKDVITVNRSLDAIEKRFSTPKGQEQIIKDQALQKLNEMKTDVKQDDMQQGNQNQKAKQNKQQNKTALDNLNIFKGATKGPKQFFDQIKQNNQSKNSKDDIMMPGFNFFLKNYRVQVRALLLDTFREASEVIATGTAFILTNNLLTSYTMILFGDMIYNICVRYRKYQIDQKQAEKENQLIKMFEQIDKTESNKHGLENK